MASAPATTALPTPTSEHAMKLFDLAKALGGIEKYRRTEGLQHDTRIGCLNR